MSYVAPLPSAIRSQSKVQFATYGYPTPAQNEGDSLEPLIAQAIAEIDGKFAERGVWFVMDQIPAPSSMQVLMDSLLRMWVEYLVVLSQPETADASGSYEYLASVTSANVTDNYREVGSKYNFHPFPPIDRLFTSFYALWGKYWPGLQGDDDYFLSGAPGISVLERVPVPGENIVDDPLPFGVLPIIYPIWPA